MIDPKVVGGVGGAGAVPSPGATGSERLPGESQFDRVLGGGQHQEHVRQHSTFNDLGATSTAQVSPPPPVQETHKAPRLDSVVQQVIDGGNRMSEIQHMLTDPNLRLTVQDPAKLLAIQIEVQDITKQIELMAKMVEGATSGIKQTLQMQV